MDRLDAMALVLDVVDCGSFSAAGRRRATPLTTVSRTISQLEAQIGARLFNRNGRRLALTTVGENYVAACRRILEDVREIEQAVSGEFQSPRGVLTIAAPIVFGRLHVLPIITDFLQKFPEINVRLALSDGNVDLATEPVDLAIRIGDLPDSSLIATRLGVVSYQICASPAYFASRGVPQNPADLADHDCIAFDRFSRGRLWRFSQNGAEVHFIVRPRLEVTTAEAAIDAAIAHLGVTRALSYQLITPLRSGSLALALVDFAPPDIPVHLIRHSERTPQKLRAFVDFAVPLIKRRLEQAAMIAPDLS